MVIKNWIEEERNFPHVSSMEIDFIFNMHIFDEQQFHEVSKKGSNCLLNDGNAASCLEKKEYFWVGMGTVEQNRWVNVFDIAISDHTYNN